MHQNKVLTLYYHRVNDLKYDRQLLCVTPVRFRQQMLYLKSKYTIARFDDDWTQLDSDAVVITFDDGYLDNYTNALSVLDELEIPATIFVTTGTLSGDRELWWDELETVLLDDGDYRERFRLDDAVFNCEWRTDTYEYRQECYTTMHRLMRDYITPKDRERWFDQLWKWRGMPRYINKANATLTEDTCKKLAASKYISIGAHTISHPSLGRLTAKEQRKEILTSVDYLESVLGFRTDIFSYPFGNSANRDYNEDTISICKEAGIKKAASTDNGLWMPGSDDYRIPRACMRNWDLYEYKNILDRFFEKGWL